MANKLTLGIDIGSTTTKLVLLENGKSVYEKYQRHLSQVRQTTLEMLLELKKAREIDKLSVAVSGSAGMGMAEAAGLSFVQEVYATGEVVSRNAKTGTYVNLLEKNDKVYSWYESELFKKCAEFNALLIETIPSITSRSSSIP